MEHVTEESKEETKVICIGLDGAFCGSIVEEDNGNFELELCNSCNETHLNSEGYKTCRKCIKVVAIKDGGGDSEICQFCLEKNK